MRRIAGAGRPVDYAAGKVQRALSFFAIVL
jgi:hypothetical protein